MRGVPTVAVATALMVGGLINRTLDAATVAYLRFENDSPNSVDLLQELFSCTGCF